MLPVRRVANGLSTGSVIFLAMIASMTALSGCSGDVHGPAVSVTASVPDSGINEKDPDFTAEKMIDTEIPVEGRSRIDIEAINGAVAVAGDPDVDAVIVTAHLKVGSDSQADADRHLEDLDIVVTVGAEAIVLQTVHPQDTGGRRYQVEYSIILPIDLAVVTSQVNGNVDVDDIQNSVEVMTINGDIRLAGIVGGVVADVTNGGIDADVVLPAQATIDLSANNGSIELRIPRSTSAVMDAAVVSGAVQTTDLVFDDLVQTDRSLSGILGGGEGAIILWANTGFINVVGLD